MQQAARIAAAAALLFVALNATSWVLIYLCTHQRGNNVGPTDR